MTKPFRVGNGQRLGGRQTLPLKSDLQIVALQHMSGCAAKLAEVHHRLTTAERKINMRKLFTTLALSLALLACAPPDRAAYAQDGEPAATCQLNETTGKPAESIEQARAGMAKLKEQDPSVEFRIYTDPAKVGAIATEVTNLFGPIPVPFDAIGIAHNSQGNNVIAFYVKGCSTLVTLLPPGAWVYVRDKIEAEGKVSLKEEDA